LFLDSLARDGVHCANAFVTTALCSPSRASILTGKYAHQHKIVDNNTAIPPGTTFFPQLLPKAGYATSFFGKWHMGNGGDEPQPGFDRWVSFRGTYLPGANGLNVNGKHVPQRGFSTDELTDYALDWPTQRWQALVPLPVAQSRACRLPARRASQEQIRRSRVRPSPHDGQGWRHGAPPSNVGGEPAQ